MEKIKSLLATADVTIKSAWKQLNDNGFKALFIVDSNGKLVGSVSDGDIRRWILQEGSLSDSVEKVMNLHPISVHSKESRQEARELLLKHRIDCLPVLNPDGTIREVLFWDEFFTEKELPLSERLNLPVVIMAGGRGQRLDPFTKILPKPLMPVGEKPFIEMILDRFGRHGIKNFFLSLNYKSSMIKAFFEDLDHSFNIEYLFEQSPLGTAGSLSLLEERLQSTFIVTNADILVETNYAELFHFHQKNKNQLTLVCSMKHVPIPYGVVEIENGGTLKGIREKPEMDHLVTTGLYVMEPELIRMIPKNQEFDMTHLIEKAKREDQRIGVYPVAEKTWLDIGELEVYQETLKRFQ